MLAKVAKQFSHLRKISEILTLEKTSDGFVCEMITRTLMNDFIVHILVTKKNKNYFHSSMLSWRQQIAFSVNSKMISFSTLMPRISPLEPSNETSFCCPIVS